MREIKFRVWNEINEMLYPDGNGYFDDGKNFVIDGLGELIYLDDNSTPNGILMQFTGLKDKNGIDIYEDSIFHCNGVNYILKYKLLGGAYTVHNIKDDTDERFLHHCNHQIEIIGNIYENPELLTK